MNKLVLMVAAAVLSTSSFAGIVSDSYDKSKFGEEMQQAKDKLTEAHNFIMDGEILAFTDGLGCAQVAIDTLKEMVASDSEEANKLTELFEKLGEKQKEVGDKVADAKDNEELSKEVTDDVRAFFPDVEKELNDIVSAIDKEMAPSDEPSQDVASEEEKSAEESTVTEDKSAEESMVSAEEKTTEETATEEQPKEEPAPALEENTSEEA